VIQRLTISFIQGDPRPAKQGVGIKSGIQFGLSLRATVSLHQLQDASPLMIFLTDVLDLLLSPGWRQVIQRVRADAEISFRRAALREYWDGWVSSDKQATEPPWFHAAREYVRAIVLAYAHLLFDSVKSPDELEEYVGLSIHFAAAEGFFKIAQYECSAGTMKAGEYEGAERRFEREMRRFISPALADLYLDKWVQYAAAREAQSADTTAEFSNGDLQKESTVSSVVPAPGEQVDTGQSGAQAMAEGAKPTAVPRGSGRQWSDLEIVFLDEQSLEIRIKGEPPFSEHYIEMGFLDERKRGGVPTPVDSWGMLQAMARRDGSLPDPVLGQNNYRPTKSKRELILKAIRDLKDRISNYFPGIEGPPIRYSKGTGHQTAFKLSRHPDFDCGQTGRLPSLFAAELEHATRTSNIKKNQFYDEQPNFRQTDSN
jgi:hypothetical protein